MKSKQCHWHREEAPLRADDLSDRRVCPGCMTPFNASPCAACGGLFLDWENPPKPGTVPPNFRLRDGALLCETCQLAELNAERKRDRR